MGLRLSQGMFLLSPHTLPYGPPGFSDYAMEEAMSMGVEMIYYSLYLMLFIIYYFSLKHYNRGISKAWIASPRYTYCK